MTIFKACDVRGIVGQQWDCGDARRIGHSLGQMLRTRHQSTIVVGGDFRRSTASLKEALITGLRQAGVLVQDVGQVPTPVVQFAARQAACGNLAIVTASHNPGKYNGVKFLVDGLPPVPEMVRELQQGCSAEVVSGEMGTWQQCDVREDYQRWVVRDARRFVDGCLTSQAGNFRTAIADPETSSTRGGTIAIDTMGGAFTGIAPDVLRSAGYKVVSVDDQLDQDFARRDPNPAVDANLQPLIETVRASHSALGLALDGDGDRVIFVDHLGTIARPEQIAAMLIRYGLRRCSVVYDLKCASLVARAAAEQGGVAMRQPSGHGFIKRKLLELQAELGVEVSGHHFFGVIDGGDDGLFTALVLLSLLDRHRARLADWLQEIGWPAITPDLRIPYAGDAQQALEIIAATCGGQVSRLDGVRADYEHGSWALARASITEPVVTLRFEAGTPAELRPLVGRFLAGVPDLSRTVMEKL